MKDRFGLLLRSGSGVTITRERTCFYCFCSTFVMVITVDGHLFPIVSHAFRAAKRRHMLNI